MNLPFTNIRQVLSLHNKVSPEKIFLTVITDQGREELNYAEFSARCHQTANFLQEDLGIKPGDVVVIVDNENPADTAVLIMACWLVGAVVAPYNVNRTDARITLVTVKAHFIRHHNEPNSPPFNRMAKLYGWENGSLVQLGGEPTTNALHFDTLVRGMPNSFFNDHPEPTLDSPAFTSSYYDADRLVTVTQGELFDATETMTHKQVITGNQRLITYLKLSGSTISPSFALDAISIFMGTLLVGGSLVFDTRFFPHIQPDIFWRVVAAERLHIACVLLSHIKELIAFAKEQKAAGKPIYGEGVYQQDIQQLRHIYCPDATSDDIKLIQEFTAMFPFPVITNI